MGRQRIERIALSCIRPADGLWPLLSAFICGSADGLWPSLSVQFCYDFSVTVLLYASVPFNGLVGRISRSILVGLVVDMCLKDIGEGNVCSRFRLKPSLRTSQSASIN